MICQDVVRHVELLSQWCQKHGACTPVMDCVGGDAEKNVHDNCSWIPPPEIGPFPIVALFRHPTHEGRFLLSVSGKASRNLYDLCFKEEEPVVLPGMSAAVTSVKHSVNGMHFVMGSCDGAVRVYPVQPFGLPRRGDLFWESQVHDMHHAVTSASVTFDGTSLISAASDGSVFSYKLVDEAMIPGEPQDGLANERFGLLEDYHVSEAQDVADMSTYTIEQAKQQQEQDLLMAAAEAKKGTVRQAVAQYAFCSMHVSGNRGLPSDLFWDLPHT
jgi:hypothetical protein